MGQISVRFGATMAPSLGSDYGSGSGSGWFYGLDWIGPCAVCAAFWAELEPHKFRSSSLPLCGIVYADNYDGATIELSVSRVGYGGTGLENDEGESLGGRDGGGTRTECNS